MVTYLLAQLTAASINSVKRLFNTTALVKDGCPMKNHWRNDHQFL